MARNYWQYVALAHAVGLVGLQACGDDVASSGPVGVEDQASGADVAITASDVADVTKTPELPAVDVQVNAEIIAADTAKQEDGGQADGANDANTECKTALDCPMISEPCQTRVCSNKGSCSHNASPDGSPCDDGKACTLPDECQNGACLPGAVTNCNDNNACTMDSCDDKAGCSHAPTLLPCSDDNACTENDQCQGGACAAGKQKVCSDGNFCTQDSCDSVKGCIFVMSTAACDDGSACTFGDACSGGVCLPGAQTNCDDDNVCTSDSCAVKTGCIHANNAVQCDDGDECSKGDKCQDGGCVGVKAVVCNDGNPCTDDTCDLKGGCIAVANTKGCSDGNACTLGDTCAGGGCVPGVVQDCDDGNPCTIDSCDAKLGCVHINGAAPCDDGSACTNGDTCADGKCAPGKAIPCIDGNVCTDDGCDAKNGCVFAPNTVACDDGNACTLGETCGDAKCLPGKVINCDDGNLCTLDGCDAVAGCTHGATNVPCDDNNACTKGDLCGKGNCIPGSKIVCNDGNICTDDSCDANTGCATSNNIAACNDSNACTSGDHCGSGICLPGAPIPCNDNNYCTNDSCDPVGGCANFNNLLPCDDGSICTNGDACAGGKCVAGAKIVCNDGNLCTTDACDAKLGCTTVYNAVACNDSNACTAGDTCSAGNCVGKVIVCDDGNTCTEDICDASKGCLGIANLGVCTDSNVCTLGDTCKAAVCVTNAKLDCDDLNACTADSCDPIKGCQHPNAIDGVSCGAGKCIAGVCSIGTQANPATSCKQIIDLAPKSINGIYWLDPDGVGPLVPFQAYCEMKLDGGGWTLLLKVDGAANTFQHDQGIWTTGDPLNAAATDLDTKEARLPSYSSVPFTNLRIGMKVGVAAPNFIVVPLVGTSLFALMKGGKYVASTVGRDVWKALLVDSSLQQFCNQEGLNTLACRIGITNNQENDCNSPDSWLGIGCGSPTAGNYANGSWQPDNGAKNTVAFSYVLAR